MPSETDLFWVAGILEGEGSFMMVRNTVKGKVYFYPQIVVTMTDKDIIDRVAVIFGNATYFIPHTKIARANKDQYRAQISGAPAAELMRLLLPIMGDRRRAKITEILAEYDGRPDANDLRRAWGTKASQTRTRTEKGRYT